MSAPPAGVPGDPDDLPRPGAALAAATVRAAENTGIAVRPLRCLANCKRGCSAVMRRLDAWSYVFGHLDAEPMRQALVQGAQLLSRSADGLMPWRGRPEALKRGLIARMPPIDFLEQMRMTDIAGARAVHHRHRLSGRRQDHADPPRAGQRARAAGSR